MEFYITGFYCILFIITEFRFKNIKSLTSPIYFIALAVCLWSFILIYYFFLMESISNNIVYYVFSLLFFMQVQAFLYRSYLWNFEDNPLGIYLHPQTDHDIEYYPERVKIFDFLMTGLICLYLYICCNDFQSLKYEFNF